MALLLDLVAESSYPIRSVRGNPDRENRLMAWENRLMAWALPQQRLRAEHRVPFV
jgi:hypothetical protein